MIEGQQFRFALDGVWRSEVPPKPGLDVEVELDHILQVTGITVVPAFRIEREHAQGKRSIVKRMDGDAGHKLIAKFVALALVAIGLLLAGWYLLRN